MTTPSLTLDVGFGRRGSIRLIRQSEIAECGLACIAMVAQFHGFDVDLGTLRRRYAPSLRGAPLKELIEISDQLGLLPRPVKLDLEDLSQLNLPAILHWDLNHYVVLESVSGGRCLIHNPDGQTTSMSLEAVSPHFTGVALELRPSANFQKGVERQTLKLKQLWSKLTGLKRSLLQLILLSVVLQAFVLTMPYYMQVAIDTALPALDLDLLVVLAVGFGIFTVFNAVASLLRSWVLLNAGATIGFGLASNIARRLFRLPIDWFEKRHTGDVLSRFQSIAPIQRMLTEGAVAALIDGVMAIFTLTVMFIYSAQLASIALTAFSLYLCLRLITYSFQREAEEANIVTDGKEQTTLIESLRGMVALRLAGKETVRHSVWQSRLADSVNADVRQARIQIWQSTGNILIFGLENIITIWLAISFIIEGAGFSVGMLFAYMAYRQQFMEKSTNLIVQIIEFRMLGLHLERLSDIALSDEDRGFTRELLPETPLKGKIELRGVHYRYSPRDPFVVENVNLTIEPGRHVVITGPSGGGKSTLLKIILGLVEPEAGEIIIDNVPLDRFGLRSYQKQLACVLQEDHLFAGSVVDNIALFDEEVDMHLVQLVAKAAAIHEEIMDMPMQYETLVGDMGSTLSGGQKQRLLLARALYRKPRFLVMDEGTSHLDAEREKQVSNAIGRLGITRVIVAHRQETVSAGEEVYRMENGILHPQRVMAPQSG